MKTIIINTLFILISTFAFAQQNNPSLIIDLTEKQAFERYKKSNVRKALGLKIKDFNYKDLINVTEAKKLSELAVLNNTSNEKLIRYAKTIINYSNQPPMPNGLPLCDDCSMIYTKTLNGIKEYSFKGVSYDTYD